MIDDFKEIATNVDNRFIRKHKETGGKVVGYSCSFLPVGEIYHSVGMLAMRVRGNEAKDTTIGDTYYGPVICSFPKCILQMVGEGKYKHLDGMIQSTGCDAMRRLDECWRKAGTDYEGIVPDFWYFFGIPHKSLDFSIKWFADEIRKHIDEMETHFNVKITEEALGDSIKTYNKARRLLQEFNTIRTRKNPPISGADATAVLVSAASIPMDDYIQLLEDLIADLKKKRKKINGKRIMVVGSVNDDPVFLETLEEMGAVIVADTNCFGSRFFENMVDEEGDPIEALARGYLDNVRCPRMFGQYKQRLEYYMDKIKGAEIDGVVLQNIRFCDLHGSENGVLERDFEAAGIPCMKMEREYGTLVETGRIKMRMEAFIERLA